MNWSWMLPETFSTYGPTLDRIYYIILIITAIVFVLTEFLLFYFMWKYRHREGHKAEPIHGNERLEIVWTSATILILVVIAVPSGMAWNEVKQRVPEGGLGIVVTARQFEWSVTYPGPDEVIGTADDFETLNTLHVPLGRPTVVTLRAEDVLHSLFIPAMRVKQDAVPGEDIPVWFEPIAAGEYDVGCAELCGIGHTNMQGSMTVYSAQDYAAWVASQSAELPQ